MQQAIFTCPYGTTKINRNRGYLSQVHTVPTAIDHHEMLNESSKLTFNISIGKPLLDLDVWYAPPSHGGAMWSSHKTAIDLVRIIWPLLCLMGSISKGKCRMVGNLLWSRSCVGTVCADSHSTHRSYSGHTYESWSRSSVGGYLRSNEHGNDKHTTTVTALTLRGLRYTRQTDLLQGYVAVILNHRNSCLITLIQCIVALFQSRKYVQ